MKEILKEYKKQIKYFIENKKYMLIIILVMILSYGFTITHYSIGVDDLAFDRYVNGTHILSQKRWGTWGLYNLLRITEFTPFWLEAISAIIIVIIAITICVFIKKQYKEKIKLGGYIIFSSILISNPLINQFFIYQSTNLAVAISNLIVIICGIVIYENYFNQNKKWINIISGIILTIPIAMYEACAQTYIVFIFVAMFIKLTEDNTQNKKVIKYFFISISMLIIGIAIYFITGKIILLLLEKLNKLEVNRAYTMSLWLEKEFWELDIKSKLTAIDIFVLKQFAINNGYLPITTFVIFSFTAIIIEAIKLIKNSKVFRFISTIRSNTFKLYISIYTD
ncbi:MAG: hypothetical protein HFJ51_02570 [Clostridia bacterium]|nr:hypothetical protein [Clostridia bacterium]